MAEQLRRCPKCNSAAVTIDGEDVLPRGAAVKCTNCEWKGRTSDLRSYGYEKFEPEGDGPITEAQALEGINRIRNSIVGAQTINWSEHIYPLVALLGRAGIEGLPYPEARANIGTLLDNYDEAKVLLRAACGEAVTHELHEKIGAFLERVDA